MSRRTAAKFHGPLSGGEPCPPVYRRGGANLYRGDFPEVSGDWPSPTVLVVDGPYGVAGYPGDPVSHEDLAEWYLPHVAYWSEHSLPETTLWFWNTEIGWASVHPALARHGWEYRSCHVWDKGLGPHRGQREYQDAAAVPRSHRGLRSVHAERNPGIEWAGDGPETVGAA